MSKCSICDLGFGEFDDPIRCDGCQLPVHNKCSNLSAVELKCLSAKNRNLKYFCEACKLGLKEIPDLKRLLSKLLHEVENLKKSTVSSAFQSEEFIINEINQRQLRASNLIFYNVVESMASKVEDRVSHDFDQVNEVLQSIMKDTVVKPIKVIRLGRSASDKPRPLKVLFNSASEAFDVIKNKKINIESSSCVINQHKYR